jgi:hypothetical protein
LNYAGVSFAILEDRKFKSAPDEAFAMLKDGGGSVHTFNVWMREDGHRFDSFILTQDESFDPGPPPPLTANADGMIAGEAEDYDAIFEGSLGPHNWELFSDIEGFQGTGFMRAMPDGGASTGAAGDLTGEQGGVSPRMDYQVDFPAGGTWFVHLRGLTTGKGDDSGHVGVNLVLDDLRTSWDGDDNAWYWTSIFANRTDEVRDRMTVTVPSAGVHTFNVWMREDGHRFDSFILTQDESFDPNPALAPVLSITAGVGEVTVEWTSGQLQGADNVEGPYSDVAGTSPLTVPATGAARFYRAQ